MSAASRNKGSRVEREIAKLLTEAGIPTRRVIGSGAHGAIDPRLEGDLQIGTLPLGDWLLTGECKARKDGAGFALLSKWLGKNDVLILKQDREAPTVYMNWEPFRDMVYVYYHHDLEPIGAHWGKNK